MGEAVTRPHEHVLFMCACKGLRMIGVATDAHTNLTRAWPLSLASSVGIVQICLLYMH